MSEYTIGLIACLSLVGLAISAYLYMLGGRSNKWIRRFIASFVITGTVALASHFMGCFSWWILALYPLKCAEFIQGYGVSGTRPKWLKRLTIAGTSLAYGVGLCFILGGSAWYLLTIHLWLGLCTTQFAFKNPVHAAAEEPLVCMLNNLIVVFYPFAVGLS